MTVQRYPEFPTDKQDVALLLSPARPDHVDESQALPEGLVAMSDLHGYSNRVARKHHADRFFELLAHHGAASRRETFVARHREHVKGFVTSKEDRPAIELRHASAIALPFFVTRRGVIRGARAGTEVH